MLDEELRSFTHDRAEDAFSEPPAKRSQKKCAENFGLRAFCDPGPRVLSDCAAQHAAGALLLLLPLERLQALSTPALPSLCIVGYARFSACCWWISTLRRCAARLRDGTAL